LDWHLFQLTSELAERGISIRSMAGVPSGGVRGRGCRVRRRCGSRGMGTDTTLQGFV